MECFYTFSVCEYIVDLGILLTVETWQQFPNERSNINSTKKRDVKLYTPFCPPSSLFMQYIVILYSFSHSFQHFNPTACLFLSLYLSLVYILQNVDTESMGLILTGLARCGAWGCFDEFNRLQEATLSAISMLIQPIQCALKDKSDIVQIAGKDVSMTAGCTHTWFVRVCVSIS